MKFSNIPFIPGENYNHDKLSQHGIYNEPWNVDKGPSCAASFSIAHFDLEICSINDEVNRDNCVEFFIAFGGEKKYYNFEFNYLGSVKAAFGKDRSQRDFLPAALSSEIEDGISISLNNLSVGKWIQWDIHASLPVSVFCYHRKLSLSGETALVNFTKC